MRFNSVYVNKSKIPTLYYAEVHIVLKKPFYSPKYHAPVRLVKRYFQFCKLQDIAEKVIMWQRLNNVDRVDFVVFGKERLW